MAEQERGRGGKRRYWNWLLATPLVLLVYPGMYARSAPALLGFPFFYWYQFAVVIATALLTGVHRAAGWRCKTIRRVPKTRPRASKCRLRSDAAGRNSPTA